MGKVRWSRGFFRLWVVLSSLWVLGLAALWWQPALFPIAYFPSRYFAIPTATGIPEVITQPSKELDALTQAKADGKFKLIEISSPPDHPSIPTNWLFLRAETSHPQIEDAVDKVVAISIAEERAQIEALAATNKITAAMMILFPPLVLLALGSALAWGLRGFRYDERDSANRT